MDVFQLRNRLIDEDYQSFVSSFLQIRDPRIGARVTEELGEGRLWPEPRIGLNPAFESGGTVGELIDRGLLHDDCRDIFRAGKERGPGSELRFHRHQVDAIEAAARDANYVLTTGTGSGKSLSYIVPIVDHVLRTGSGEGIKAIVVYPMNALANSQRDELDKFLKHGFGTPPVTYQRYTGQETRDEKDAIKQNPPDILLTNYVMLELILTRVADRAIVDATKDLRFLVLDELHTYRGRQGADVSFLVRRLREASGSDQLRCVGTSATMATGTFDERRKIVADVASNLFGAPVAATDVIGETLQRATPEISLDDPAVRSSIEDRVRGRSNAPTDPAEFLRDPLTSWIESSFGIEQIDERWERVTPRPIGGSPAAGGAAHDLANALGIDDVTSVEAAVKHHLMLGSGVENPRTGFPVFAFRLHQFVSRGDTVHATLERPSIRHLTLQEQRTVPGDASRVLLPLAFCRGCGQEYYSVFRDELRDDAAVPRRLDQRQGEDGQEPGFLYIPPDDPSLSDEAWSDDPNDVITRVPQDWVDFDKQPERIKSDRKKLVPAEVWLKTDGGTHDGPTKGWWIPAPFRFCLACGMAYGSRVRSDLTKLTTLGAGGRSSALTELSLSAVRWLRSTDLPGNAKKLLAFTDNRQDASLQAGNFNDFLAVTMVRAALVKAMQTAGPDGLRHDHLPHEVAKALDAPLEVYAANPQVRFAAKEEVERTLREVLAYLVYQDLERGWRVTQPNLEQTGLLAVGYAALDEVVRAEDVWAEGHPALVTASPATRERICRVLADFLRRELAIDVDVLDRTFQEQLLRRSDQHLVGRLALDDDLRDLKESSEALFRSRKSDDHRGKFTFVSTRSAFGQFLRRSDTFPEYGDRITVAETQELLDQLAKALTVGGIFVHGPNHTDADPSYRLTAASLLWRLGDARTQADDPLRIARPPKDGLGVNAFFRDLYRSSTPDLATLEAHEHTAQVSMQDRLDRERDFKSGELPILYCSPTMELGVDISQLNVVGMRNVPPTQANYAQRSGRAGRSGQPALVFTYATSGSPHDQYYFKHPDRMVAGRVEAPRIDLTNEDLVRSHVHSVWLRVSGHGLGHSLLEVLDLDRIAEPKAALLAGIEEALTDTSVHRRSAAEARRVLDTVASILATTPWWDEGWLDTVMAGLHRHFIEAAQRWWDLYQAAHQQRDAANGVIRSHSASRDEKNQARRRRNEAEKRVELLEATADDSSQHDFDPYRYFAAEGFLPGYSFPRLPLTAFIPGRRGKGDGNYLQRGRFLAVSEFGPRALIYHEGNRYRVTRADLPIVAPAPGEQGTVVTTKAKRCESCGYLHPIAESNPDLCERCGNQLDMPLRDLFRLQNVSTSRVDRISSDEEERQRQGFEIISGVRFAQRDHRLSRRRAEIIATGSGGSEAAVWGHLTYGSTATLWRLNLGWRRRKNKHQHGFVLDLQSGVWARNDALDDGDDQQEGAGERVGSEVRRVIPYVEDTRNVLLLEPAADLPIETLASLESALTSAIQLEFQLEDNELASEALPTSDDRRLLLFFESAEGGAGVLRQLVNDPTALARVARRALELCHVDAVTLDDEPDACAVACYECLLSYSNQRDHQLLERSRAIHVLRDLIEAPVRELPDDVGTASTSAGIPPTSTSATPGGDGAESGRATVPPPAIDLPAESELEQRFVAFLEDQQLRVPQRGRRLDFETISSTPDYWFPEDQLVIYVDGPPHDFPERQQRDAAITSALRDQGYRVARFGHDADWAQVIDSHRKAFGATG